MASPLSLQALHHLLYQYIGRHGISTALGAVCYLEPLKNNSRPKTPSGIYNDPTIWESHVRATANTQMQGKSH